MRKYSNNSNAKQRVAYGIELQAGLDHFTETKPLGVEFGVITEELNSARAAREPLQIERSRTRARVRFANYQFDTVLRQMGVACEGADGGQRGPVFGAVFPDNLTCVITPVGEGQVKAGEAFLRTFEASGIAGVAAVREVWLPKVKAALEELKAALAARDEAGRKLAVARAREEALCEDHEIALERVMGQVRTIFPRQRDLWDVIFPPAPRAPRTDDDDPATPEDPAI